MTGLKKKVSLLMAAAVSAATLAGCAPMSSANQQTANQGNNKQTIALKTAPAPNDAVDNSTSANKNSQGATASINDNAPRQFKSEGLSIEEIVKQNINSVVTVAVTKVENGGILGSTYQKGVGTGFFIDASGLVATNNHVIEGANDVQIILYDGTKAKGQVLWADPANDLAVVQMDKSVKVPGVVTIGNSDDVQVGEQVVAIGNPMSVDFAGTVTNGIISAKNRKLTVGGREFNYLQTNAAINGGNSGGPLFNSRGQVIGINSAKISQLEIEGISFAIPINTFMTAVAGKPNTSQASNQTIIGIELADITAEAQATAKSKYGLNLPQGVLITKVLDGSPAQTAGLLTDDIIVEFDGKKISKGTELNAIKSAHKAGDKIKVVIYRFKDNKYYESELTLAAR